MKSDMLQSINNNKGRIVAHRGAVYAYLYLWEIGFILHGCCG